NTIYIFNMHPVKASSGCQIIAPIPQRPLSTPSVLKASETASQSSPSVLVFKKTVSDKFVSIETKKEYVKAKKEQLKSKKELLNTKKQPLPQPEEAHSSPSSSSPLDQRESPAVTAIENHVNLMAKKYL